MYRSRKAKEKSNTLTRQSKDVFKEKNDTNERSKYQHQIILKIENLNEKIAKSYLRFISLILAFQNNAIIDAKIENSHLEES